MPGQLQLSLGGPEFRLGAVQVELIVPAVERYQDSARVHLVGYPCRYIGDARIDLGADPCALQTDGFGRRGKDDRDLQFAQASCIDQLGVSHCACGWQQQADQPTHDTGCQLESMSLHFAVPLPFRPVGTPAAAPRRQAPSGTAPGPTAR